jgi:hypothetical protein
LITGFDCRFQGKVSFAECLSCAATQENPCPFDFALLQAMIRELSRHVEGLRVTQLTGCLRRPLLEDSLTYYDRPERCYYAFRGTLVHRLLEGAQLSAVVHERRFWRKVAGVAISGQPDLICPQEGLLREYKTIRRIDSWLREPKPAHVEQVNLYRWLLAERIPIHRAEILYLDMSRTARFDVPLRPLEEIEALVVRRVRLVQRGLAGESLPPRLRGEQRYLCRGYCPFTTSCWPEGVPPTVKGGHTRKEEDDAHD